MGCLFVQVRFSSAQSAPPEAIAIARFISRERGVDPFPRAPVKVSCFGRVLRAAQRDVLPSAEAEAELVLPPAGAAFLSALAHAWFPSPQATAASVWALAHAESP